MNLLPRVFRVMVSSCLFFSVMANANVVINGTRVIYPAADHEVVVQLVNHGSQPALVQAWLDDGDAKASPEQSKTPFVMTPPIARIEPDRGQALRLMFTGAGARLPKDRESLFWLNVLDIPPAPKPDGVHNYLQLAIRSRIKVFYRPPHLPGSLIDAPKQLRWRIVPASGGGWVLECQNPTAYYLSFSDASVALSGHLYSSKDGGMAPPSGQARFHLEGLVGKPPPGTEVQFSVINDYGGREKHKAKL